MQKGLPRVVGSARTVAKPVTTLLVANPTARTGRAEQHISRAMDALAEARLQPEFFPTLPAGQTVGMLASRLDREDVARTVDLFEIRILAEPPRVQHGTTRHAALEGEGTGGSPLAPQRQETIVSAVEAVFYRMRWVVGQQVEMADSVRSLLAFRDVGAPGSASVVEGHF